MAGFDEFLKVLRETSNGRTNSTNGLNGILNKINESIRMQNELKEKADSEIYREVEEPSIEEQRLEDQKQRMITSNNIIMNNNSVNTDKAIANSQTNLNSKEIFPLSFNSEDVVQGLIFSEILGTPICKRKHRKRR